MNRSTRGRWSRLRRLVMAEARDLRILMAQFAVPLLGFAGLILGGAGLILALHRPAAGETPLDYTEAIYTVFCMVFFEPQGGFPHETPLRVMYFLVPLFGLAFLADGLVRFSILVFNKEVRGEAWQRVLASTYSNHLILCGLGHVGYRVAREFLRLGEDFVVIAQESEFVDTIRKQGVPVLIGKAQDDHLLGEANVARARTIVVATDNDLANLETVVSARQRNPSIRVMVRLFDGGLASKMQQALGIEMAFSTSQVTAPAVALAAVERDVVHSFYVGGDLLNVVELSVAEGSAYVGRPLEELERGQDLTVVVHTRGGVVKRHPEADLVLAVGDGLVLLCSRAVLKGLREKGLQGDVAHPVCRPTRDEQAPGKAGG